MKMIIMLIDFAKNMEWHWNILKAFLILSDSEEKNGIFRGQSDLKSLIKHIYIYTYIWKKLTNFVFKSNEEKWVSSF